VSGICGYVGSGEPGTIDAMLAAIEYRGDRTDTAAAPGVGLGYRWWSGRTGKAPGIHRHGADLVACAGTLAPAVSSPAAALFEYLSANPPALDTLDGAFAAGWWNEGRKRLTLVRDPFGVRSLYYTSHNGVLYFATELKQLLAVPGLPVEIDYSALHKYLTFSFVPGEDVPIRGIKRLLPGHLGVYFEGAFTATPYFTLREEIDPALTDKRVARRQIRALCKDAIARRLTGEERVAVFLSGGIDSSGVTLWLKQAGVDLQAYSLDFGERSLEKPQAQAVAEQLQVPLQFVQVSGGDVGSVVADLVWKLDLPFGDPVTGPQYLLARAAREAGFATVFNGEGGDQLFGGWTSKPMIAAELFSGVHGDDSREELYLRSYHRFYGFEQQLYTAEFRAQVGGPGQRRALLMPYLGSDRATTFLNRVRLADISLKGSQNILPRAERVTNGHALDLRVPLFDRALAETSFRLPPQLKLHGATEKYILKLVLQRYLPREIVWRRKYGMGVPVTEWTLGPLASLMESLLGRDALEKRKLFNPEFVDRLRQGQNDPQETRRRRIGERLWTLAMLEAWLRVFVDGRGHKPGATL
jgi:asparagine synthase (glutamine-hydrolysing)